MTHEKLRKERNIFIGFFILAFILATFFQHLRMQDIQKIDENFQASDFYGYIVILRIFQGVFIYIVYRLSRLLKISTGLTVLYCMLAPVSLLQFISFTLLLVKVKSIRKSINASSESVMPTLN